ncbi:MAG: glutathione S-transferase family protein [Alphaproteobacteria bacterium]
MSKMKLFYHPASPFARKCVVVAKEVGADQDLEILNDLVVPFKVNEGIQAVSPLGKIPTLVGPEGEGIYDSRVICTYLANAYNKWEVFGTDHATHLQSEQQQALCDGICDAAVAYRYETAVRPEGMRWGDFSDRQVARIKASLEVLEKDCGSYSSERIGGIMAVIALDYLDFRVPELNWRSECPNLVKWYEDNANRPSLQATKPE